MRKGRIDMTGQRFGRYVVMSPLPPKRNKTDWLCRCDCGTVRAVLRENLLNGKCLSCGCIKQYLCAIVGQESFPRHGYFGSPEYQAWSNLKTEAKKFGFSVDPKWATDFVVFLDDMGDRPSAWHRLRRKDTRGPFNASNCFWKKPLSKEEKEVNRRWHLASWISKNREVKRLNDRLHYEANKGRYLIYGRTRRALKKHATGRHSQADIDQIFRNQRGRCGYCRIKLDARHVDHIQPLSKGGHNGRRNLQILCPACNLSKGAKDPIDYARQIGRLV